MNINAVSSLPMDSNLNVVYSRLPANGTLTKKEKNYLYGPTTSYLVSIGAKFTLCMRSDSISNVILATQRAVECGQPPNTCDNSTYAGYSCCGLPGGRKGMASLDEVCVMSLLGF